MRKAGKPMVSSWLIKKFLHRRIQETYGNSTPSVDQIVDSFREKYPEYRRHKLQRFTGMVKRSLDVNSCNMSKANKKSKRKFEDDDEDDNTSPSSCSPSSKKAKKIDSREQTQSGSSSSSSESESYSVDGEENKSVVLTSDKPKNVELEVVTCSKNNETQTVDFMMKEDRRVKSTVVKANAQKPNNSLSSDDGIDANGKDDGPRFKDFGGMDDVIKDLRRRVVIPFYHPEHLRNLGVSPTAGILLHGPPGCGKTTLARAIANETGFPLYEIAAPALVSGISGNVDQIRELFSKAYRTAPSIVFIDEIDSIASKRDNLQREMERRIVTQLMTCMDQSHSVSKQHVLVIGATNRPDALDPAIRRPGRFDIEIALGVPDQNARFQILNVVTRDMKLERNFDLMTFARATPGFVGTDLAALAKEAGKFAFGRIINARELELSKESEEIEDRLKEAWPVDETECITMLDFEGALTKVQPSSKREGFSSIPDVKWEDVGGLDTLRKEFDRYIVKRIRSPDKYEKGGVNMATGFLLYGPPGCGKTLIAKAVASEAGANFIHIKGPELLNKYVGESESQVRSTFSCARKCSPCIVFFDEVDALTTKRGNEGGWADRIVNQLLLELDGADQRKGVYVIGATNRPDVMDQAFLRPGRFEKLLYVPLPSPDERGMILKALARKKTIDADVDLIAIGRSEACANFSGADLSALMNEAAIAAVEESESSIDSLPYTIKAIHIEQALGKICPSVSDEQEQYYHRLPKRFKSM